VPPVLTLDVTLSPFVPRSVPHTVHLTQPLVGARAPPAPWVFGLRLMWRTAALGWCSK